MGEMQPGATRPAGVTEEHLLGQKTAGFRWVAPGITHGAIPAWLLLPGSAIGQHRRRSPIRRRCGHGVIPAGIRVHRPNHGPPRHNEAADDVNDAVAELGLSTGSPRRHGADARRRGQSARVPQAEWEAGIRDVPHGVRSSFRDRMTEGAGTQWVAGSIKPYWRSSIWGFSSVIQTARVTLVGGSQLMHPLRRARSRDPPHRRPPSRVGPQDEPPDPSRRRFRPPLLGLVRRGLPDHMGATAEAVRHEGRSPPGQNQAW